MECNVGKTDRFVRIVLGVVVLVLGYVFKTWWGLLGLIPVTTAVFRFCPLYPVFNIKTCKTEKES